MKTYTLELIINEGNDEFWEGILKNNSSGCDNVLDAVKDALGGVGWFEPECRIKLIKFEDKEGNII